MCLFLALSNLAKAQEPNFSLYQQTPFLTNPGSLGMADEMRVMINYRNQSVRVGENFQTSMISGFSPVSIGSHQFGVGAAFINDKSAEFVKTNGGMIGGAYSIQIWPGSNLSLGFQSGYFRRNIDMSFTTDQQYIDGGFNPNADHGESLIDNSRGFMVASTGIFWQWKDELGNRKAFAGWSVFNFNRPNTSFIDRAIDKLPVSWRIIAGYNVFQDEKLSVMPNLRWVYQADNNFFNLGSSFNYLAKPESDQKLGLSFWYSNNKTAILGLEYSQPKLIVAASYDIPVSQELNTAQRNGVFELAISMLLGKI